MPMYLQYFYILKLRIFYLSSYFEVIRGIPNILFFRRKQRGHPRTSNWPEVKSVVRSYPRQHWSQRAHCGKWPFTFEFYFSKDSLLITIFLHCQTWLFSSNSSFRLLCFMRRFSFSRSYLKARDVNVNFKIFL